MKDIFSVDFRDSIRNVIRKEIKTKYGVKIPKCKEKGKNKSGTNNSESIIGKYFGVPLDRAPSRNINEDHYFAIPLFLLDAFTYLKNHYSLEGLFRKSGSAGRQKMLREILERDGTFENCDFVHPHDVASLVKQYFRELPEPLFTSHLTPFFLKCSALPRTTDAHQALLFCCLLLPDEHLRVLKYLVTNINEIANHSLQSKMSFKNLAIVFAPNFLSASGKDRNSEKSMKETTDIVEFIFKNSEKIGMVGEDLIARAKSLSFDSCLSSSGDELEEASSRGRSSEKRGSRRDRSKSITGFLRRGFKSGERGKGETSETVCQKDIHGNAISPRSWVKNDKLSSAKDEKDYMENRLSSSSLGANGTSKRCMSAKTNSSPVRKSPRLDGGNSKQPTISLPIVKTMSTQIALTPRKNFLDVDGTAKALPGTGKKTETPLLPSKFDLPKTGPSMKNSSKASPISKGDLDYGDCEKGQGRISRQNQKPHVKKNRRASSLDRRRARYQGSPCGRVLPKTPLDSSSDPYVCSEQRFTARKFCADDENIPMETGESVYSEVGARGSHSRIPTWEKSSEKFQKSSNTKNMNYKTPSRSIRKSLSLVENRSANRGFEDMDNYERKGTGRTPSGIPMINKKSNYTTTPQVGMRSKPKQSLR